MSDSSGSGDRTEEEQREREREETDEAIEEEVVLDLEAAEEYEEAIDRLTDRVEEQQEQIDELNDLLLDLSTRVADGRDMGVCPECHGPVMKVRRLFRPTTIECRRCGEVYHRY